MIFPDGVREAKSTPSRHAQIGDQGGNPLWIRPPPLKRLDSVARLHDAKSCRTKHPRRESTNRVVVFRKEQGFGRNRRVFRRQPGRDHGAAGSYWHWRLISVPGDASRPYTRLVTGCVISV